MSSPIERLRQIELGEKGVEYVRSQLVLHPDFRHSLSIALANHLDLNSGKVSTFLPDSLDEAKAFEFEQGDKLPLEPGAISHGIGPTGKKDTWVKVPTLDEYIVHHIDKFLRAKESNVCLFEEALPKRSDSGSLDLAQSNCFLNDRLFHLLDDESSLEVIREAIMYAGGIWPPLIGILAMPAKKVDLGLDHRTLDADDVLLLASSTREIILGAYDGEGYVIWTRT